MAPPRAEERLNARQYLASGVVARRLGSDRARWRARVGASRHCCTKPGVGQRAVVIADGDRGQGNAGSKCVDRLYEAIAEKGALATINCAQRLCRLQGDGAVEQLGGRLKVSTGGAWRVPVHNTPMPCAGRWRPPAATHP